MANFAYDATNPTRARFANNAVTTVQEAGGIVAGTTEFDVGDGTVFPDLTGSTNDYCMATLVDASGNREIIKITAVAANTITAVRGQEGTTARSYAVDDIISHRLTAGVLDDIVEDVVEHEGDIAGLLTDVATNTADIATNAGNIGTPAGADNAADIAVNTAAIAALGLQQRVRIVNRQTLGTAGGSTGYQTWTTMTLNYEDIDEGDNCSLTTNVMTLTDGTYDFDISIPMYNTSTTAVEYIGVQLYDNTSGTVLGRNDSMVIQPEDSKRIRLNGQFTVDNGGTTDVILRCWNLSNTGATYGQGYPSHTSGVLWNQDYEYYAEVNLWRQV